MEIMWIKLNITELMVENCEEFYLIACAADTNFVGTRTKKVNWLSVLYACPTG